MTDISFDLCTCGSVVVSDAQAVAELKAENERLRAREKSLTLEGLALIGRVEQTREALAGTDDASLPRDYPLERMAHDRMAEIERLRAALREIIRLDDDWVPAARDDYGYGGYLACADIARAALGGEA